MKYLLFVFLCTSLFAQNEFSTFLSYVNSISDSQQKIAAVDSFMNYARTKGIPFIEDSTASFLYRGSKNNLQIAGDFTSWNPAISMVKVQGTNLFYHSRVFEINARVDYKIITDGTWILDPENPNRVSGGFGPNSELAMPGYVQPWEIKSNASVPRGTTINKTISNSNTGTNYSLTIYLPDGYDSLNSAGYPTIYFQDGSEYISLGSSTVILDNLIHIKKIEPVIGVFIQSSDRLKDYIEANREKYRLFFVNELLPLIDSLYKTARDASRRAVIGTSAGANISALISYNHPEYFGNCGLHSGAFWPNNNEVVNLIVNGPVKNIKFVSVWGSYESVFTNMRSFRDSLLTLGYAFKWLELPEGHSWGLWRATTDFMLENFFPGSAAKVDDESGLLNDDFRLYQNYPNPFNPATVINFNLTKNSNVNLKVYNSLGSEVTTLLSEELNPGGYKVNFNGTGLSSGVYYYQLFVDNFSETRKMILIK
jgi:enterochelin esterase-like enzyme